MSSLNEDWAQNVEDGRLRALLVYSKGADEEWSWRGVADALAPLYGHRLTLAVVVHHVIAGYQDLAQEPRYQVPRPPALWIEQLILSPIQGLISIDMLGPGSLDTAYTVEQFYGAMIRHVLGRVAVAAIGWLRPGSDLAEQVAGCESAGKAVLVTGLTE